MKHKIWKYARFIVIPLLCVLLCNVLYRLTDEWSEGVIADWLDRNFTYETTSHDAEGNMILIHSYNWNLVKAYIFWVLLVICMIGSVLLMIIFDYQKRKHNRENAHKIAGYMQRYIIGNEPLPTESEYAEVFARISEIKYDIQHRERLLKTEMQRKDDLIAYLAHDLKTPLTSVIGYLTLLRDEQEISDELRLRYTGIAVKKAERLEDLLNEMLEITRFNISKVELEPENVNLSLMLEQIIYEFRPLLAEKSLNISTDIEPEVQVYCDIDKMERVMDNLIRNAVSYSDSNSEIAISLKKTDSEITMVFKNKGRTIPQEKLNRIFDQFFRLDSSRSSLTGGSGLGLAISKQLLEAHGGTITANSEQEHIWFTVVLPTRL